MGTIQFPSEYWSTTSSATWTRTVNNNDTTMNKALQIAFFCLVAVSAAYAQYGYPGYPYPGAPHGAPQPVADTPEVAAAKAAHFAAYNAAASAAASSPDYGHGAPAPAYAGQYAGAPAYGGPYAGVPNIVNGVPADTPEVAAAKAAHFAAHAQAGNHYG